METVEEWVHKYYDEIPNYNVTPPNYESIPSYDSSNL